MIEIRFSKTNSNTYQIQTDKEIERYYRPWLRSYNFKNISTTIWENQDDDEQIIEIIYNLFTSPKFKITPNSEIKKIREGFEQQREEYIKFVDIGENLKKDKNPKLPKIGLKKDVFLKQHQKMPVNHMITIPNTANFSIPGSGKTLMTLSAFNVLKNQNKIDQMWVIGPLSSFNAWETDYEYFFEKPKSTHTIRYAGAISERKQLRNKLKNKDIVISSYGTISNDIDLIKLLWKVNDKRILLVLDESHRIKSIEETTPEGNDTTSSKMIQLGKHATRRCILTGTPIPKDLEDLWSQITFLWPHIEPFKQICGGSRKEFQRFLKEEFDKEDQIKETIDFMWSRVTNKEMAPEMPERFYEPIPIVMDDTQQQIYSIIKHQIINEMDEGRSQEAVRKLRKAAIIRLMQTVTNPKLISKDDPDFQMSKLTVRKKGDQDILNLLAEYDETKVTPKIKAVAKHASELSTGKGTRSLKGKPQNVLIFTVFKGTADDLAKELQNYDPLVVKGDMDAKSREDTLEEFKNSNFSNGSGKILIATIGSIAESVSLHQNKNGIPVCQNVIYLERSYNAGQYMQSLFRVYRVGSNKDLPVSYYFYESTFNGGISSIDNTIHNILDNRTTTMFDILDDEFKLTPISMGRELDDESEEEFDDDVEDEIIQKEIFDNDED